MSKKKCIFFQETACQKDRLDRSWLQVSASGPMIVELITISHNSERKLVCPILIKKFSKHFPRGVQHGQEDIEVHGNGRVVLEGFFH